MDSYTNFAQVYDMFMDNVPYENWCNYIEKIFKQNNINDGVILDLGCGTGKMTNIMAQKGYDMIGVDLSEDMLDIARSETCEDILYLMQDMRELELYGSIKGAYCACDCLNYILDEDELLKVFKNVDKYLESKAPFIFDINTEYKFNTLLAENTFAESREEGSFIWENYFDRDSQINEYYLTLFIKDENDSKQRFLRFEETHYQRSYPLDLIIDLVKKAGMEIVAITDMYTDNPAALDSEKITIVAKASTKYNITDMEE